MRTLLALCALLLASTARAECRPAPPTVIAEAERAAGDAERKADEAESVSVRSGNPGAARRAKQARREAEQARQRAGELACTAAPASPAAKRPPPSGY